jgi:hypothetical protein
MPGDEILHQKHDESESEEEEEDVEVIPKVDIDPSTLTPLSPEVISKQVRMSFVTIWPMSDIWFNRPRSTWVGIVFGSKQYRSDSLLSRYHRACRSRKVDGRESDLRCYDCTVQKRTCS